jgi:hypothetical protein
MTWSYFQLGPPNTHCDFCGLPELGRVWFKTIPTLTTVRLKNGKTFTYDDDGEWGACALCAGFIMLKDRDGLLDRCIRVVPRATGQPASAERMAWMLDSVFWPHYQSVGSIEVGHA